MGPQLRAERERAHALCRRLTAAETDKERRATVICPGVTIGARTVVGAGSVVTKPLPPDVFAAGNPCRGIRSLQQPSSA